MLTRFTHRYTMFTSMRLLEPHEGHVQHNEIKVTNFYKTNYNRFPKLNLFR